MMRLVKRGLMFGNLFEVTAPALVERYNRAMQKLIGKTTALSNFHIDISGYSPEIGDELGDTRYLNPDGLNRQFILLSIEQRSAPLLNSYFSMSRSILRRYIDTNEEQLFALTTRDAVAGELINSVYNIETPTALFHMRDIEVEADTIEGHVAASEDLTDRIYRFMDEDDAWWDDVLIAEMIELAKRTGDIIKNPVRLEPQKFRQKNFYTSHFDGAYIFRDMKEPAFISGGKVKAADKLPVEYPCTFADRYEISAFLEINDLVEPILNARGVDSQAILRQKLDFIVIDVAASEGADLSRVSRRDLRALLRRYFNKLPDEYHAIDEALSARANDLRAARLRPDHPAYFYLLRSKQHQDRDLVNMLLAELTPLDFRQLFIFHKEAFYRAYGGWSDAKKDYTARFLADEYALDKAGARDALFGGEAAMEEEIDIGFGAGFGPWGKRQ